MTRETIELMAALADKRKIAKLDRALRRRFGNRYRGDTTDEPQENYVYDVIKAALEYCFDEYDIIEMIQ